MKFCSYVRGDGMFCGRKAVYDYPTACLLHAGFTQAKAAYRAGVDLGTEPPTVVAAPPPALDLLEPAAPDPCWCCYTGEHGRKHTCGRGTLDQSLVAWLDAAGPPTRHAEPREDAIRMRRSPGAGTYSGYFANLK